jgi:hypothetical protein
MPRRDALDVARVLLEKAGQDEALVCKVGPDTDIAGNGLKLRSRQSRARKS